MDSGQVMGMVGVIISVLTAVIGIINHKRIRSNCMGRKMEMSIDIDSTSQKSPTIAPANSIAIPVISERPTESKKIGA